MLTDGSSKEKAVLIIANNEIEGVNAEYNWLEEKFGYSFKTNGVLVQIESYKGIQKKYQKNK